jgi:acyl transferase domain-containing protein/NADP-dependent 3-hydroxy acid dehydrogenase YdfG
MSSLFAGSEDLAGLWRDIVHARDRIGDVPPTHWLVEDHYDPDPGAPDKTYCRRGGFLSPVAFDPMEFGIPPNALASTDTAQLLALIAAKRALEDAARTRSKTLDPDKISVVLGVASTTELVVAMGSRLQAPVWRKALREAGLPESQVSEICQRIAAHYTPWQESTFPGLLGNVVAGRIANRLNLGGMNCVIDAACASSLAAVELAIKELEAGDSDMVLTGGVDALNDIMMFMCFSKTPAFSPTGDCRPFSDKADGTIIGEGVGLIALRRLADAEADGDSIYAVIRGLGASSDGRASSVYAPRAEGQAKAITRAYAKAGYGPSSVELVEAHGTGTKAGDAAEFEALASVFAPDAEGRRTWCALGSIKSQLGHTKAAAGSAGLIKAALALNEKVLPPTLKVERPNPALNLEASPFYLATKARPWVRSKDHPRRASVSSFGFGGSNFHLTLEEYTGPGRKPPRLRALPEELVLLSASSRAELARAAEALAANSEEKLAAIAHRAARSFDAQAPARLALVAGDEAELAQLAGRAAQALRSETEQALRDPDIHFGSGAAQAGGLAFLFPGQGSQYVGMGAAAALAFSAARAPWDAAANHKLMGHSPLHDVAFPPEAFDAAARQAQIRRLTEMANAQPAIAAVSLGLLNLMETLGLAPDAVAGHSFGEVAALAAAGVIAREDLVQVARRRGELMADAAGEGEGAMLACTLDGRSIREILGPAGHGLVIANDNAPNQVVLAGTASAIGAAEGALKAAGMTGYRLPVATAFHSPLVAPSCRPFHDYLSELGLSVPRLPVYSNTNAAPYPAASAAIARLLSDQLARPVQFRAMIERMYADGIRRFVEVGPGRVLTGLVGLCLGERAHLSIALDDRKSSGLRALWRGLGRLAASGQALDLPALMGEYAPPAPAKRAPPHAVMISGANVGKPYPPAGGSAALPPPNPERAHVEIAAPIPALQTAPEISLAPPIDRNEAPARGTADLTGAVPDEISSLERIHLGALEAHRQYHELMADSHRAFLQLAEHAISQLSGAELRPRFEPAARTDVVSRPPPPRAAAPDSAHAPSAPSPQSAAVPLAASAPHDPTRLVVEIVAEKTGYPVDMLGLDLEMEAGLGIDSIKQVEILSALQERLPGLPEIAPTELSRLKTLRDLIARLETNLPAHSAAVQGLAPPRPSATPADPAELVLEIVAEKTGYPKDMLGLDQELEAGLGIDSIKQVEILSALQERLPGLPEITPADLAKLKTLRDVVNRLSQAAAPSRAHASPLTARAVEPRAEIAAVSLTLSTPRLVPAPLRGFDMTQRHAAETIFVTDEAPALAASIAELLEARGRRAVVVSQVPAGASAAICLAALGPGAATSLETHLAALAAARVIAHHPNPDERLFVTVQSAAGFGLASDPGGAAWVAGLPGIVKTAAREWPGAGLKAIDVAQVESAAALIVEELLAGGPELEVAFAADGERLAVQLAPETAAPRIGLPLEEGAVILVSGGARGVAATCVEALASAGKFRLALLGRTVLQAAEGDLASEDPARLVKLLASRAQLRGEIIDLTGLRTTARVLAASNAIRAQLARLAALGIEARYLPVDVRDARSLATALAGIRASWGPIGGLVHGAGVLADRKIADLTGDQFTDVFATKVEGLRALLDATRGDPIRLIAVFSSVAARLGNIGQAAYAAANEVLNKVAGHEARVRGAGVRVRAYNWGPWDGGMVDAALKAHFERQGAALIAKEFGAKFFAEDLAAARPVELVVAAPAGQSFPERRFHFTIDPARDTELLDHQIRGRIVVPVVYVLDRALRLAEAVRPSADARARLRDFRVLAGLTLQPGETARLQARLAQLTPGEDTLEIIFADDAGRVRYRALADFPFEALAAPTIETEGFSAWPVTIAQAYAGPLFHGPRFRSITALDGVSSQGGSALLATAGTLGWPASPRAIDPALLDGGLQLGLLWTSVQKGFPALPQRSGELRIHRSPMPGEAIGCTFAARPRNATHVDFDFVFTSPTGEVLAEILAAEFFAYEP